MSKNEVPLQNSHVHVLSAMDGFSVPAWREHAGKEWAVILAKWCDPWLNKKPAWAGERAQSVKAAATKTADHLSSIPETSVVEAEN